jgi:hypothetical protein
LNLICFPAWDFNQDHSAAYFRKEIKNDLKSRTKSELSSTSKNPFSGSDVSVSETSASERAATRPISRQSQRMRSTMLSQTLTPESNIYLHKSGNKSN